MQNLEREVVSHQLTLYADKAYGKTTFSNI